MEIKEMTASQLSAKLTQKEISSVELTQELLSGIEKTNPELNTFITVRKEKALEEARLADEKIANGEKLPLTGVPIALKDNISIKDTRLTCASKMLSNYTSPYNATVVEKMNSAGMVILGTLNHDEFAIGTSGESSFFGATKNPLNHEHTPGGSSSGSAASVAAGQTPLSLGSDTGGSIRVPASFCGVVGFKPTYGSVSRYGGVACASSFDQIGPIARSVEDIAMIYDVIKGQDPKDATSLKLEETKFSANKPLSGVRIGIVEDFFVGHDEIISTVMKAAHELEKQGAELVKIHIPTLEHALSAYYIISSAEISSNLGKFDGARFGYRADNYGSEYNDMFVKSRSQAFGAEVQKRVMLGTYMLTSDQYHTYFTRAKTVQLNLINDFNSVFEKCDVILTPTTIETAFKAGKHDDKSETYSSDFLTAPANLAGLPAVSVPCGFDKNKLPIGMQLIGQKLGDISLLEIAYGYEKLVNGFVGGVE